MGLLFKQFFRFSYWLFTALVILLMISWEVFLHLPIVKTHDLHYDMPLGVSASKLAHDLHHRTHLSSPFLFKVAIRLRGDDHHLQSGEYLFPKGSSVHSIIDQLVTGQVVLHSFTIVNGWTFQKVLNELQKNQFIVHSLKTKSRFRINELLGITQHSSEGWLFPETYYFAQNALDFDVLKRAHQAMESYLMAAWKKRDVDLPYKNAYQALIVASMIEKETHLKREKPIIAAVILNRLKKQMHLQIDATVVYGLGHRFSGHLTRHELHSYTPYNTYLRYGLPPTPIAMPGPESIDAALHPSNTEVLFFVAKGDGSHVFSKTLHAHQLEVKKYQIPSGD